MTVLNSQISWFCSKQCQNYECEHLIFGYCFLMPATKGFRKELSYSENSFNPFLTHIYETFPRMKGGLKSMMNYQTLSVPINHGIVLLSSMLYSSNSWFTRPRANQGHYRGPLNKPSVLVSVAESQGIPEILLFLMCLSIVLSKWPGYLKISKII